MFARRRVPAASDVPAADVSRMELAEDNEIVARVLKDGVPVVAAALSTTTVTDPAGKTPT